MATPDLPLDHSAGTVDGNNVSDALSQDKDPSRLEKVLTKGSLWKKQTLGGVEYTQRPKQEPADNDAHDTAKMANICVSLSAQLDERNSEIEQLRADVSSLKSSHRQELKSLRNELEQLQNAYQQFEEESDSLLSELGDQNERLRKECRFRNGRSLLED